MVTFNTKRYIYLYPYYSKYNTFVYYCIRAYAHIYVTLRYPKYNALVV